jgi:hypothetical protein
MALTKLYEVVETKERGKVWRTYRTEQACVDYLESNDLSDYMGSITLTIRPVWTNKNKQDIEKLLDE